MELKRCVRCGKFFASEVEVCGDCERKDFADISKLKGFIEEGAHCVTSKLEISSSTGISSKNLDRYLCYQEFSGVFSEQIFESSNEILNGAKRRNKSKV